MEPCRLACGSISGGRTSATPMRNNLAKIGRKIRAVMRPAKITVSPPVASPSAVGQPLYSLDPQRSGQASLSPTLDAGVGSAQPSPSASGQPYLVLEEPPGVSGQASMTFSFPIIRPLSSHVFTLVRMQDLSPQWSGYPSWSESGHP